MSAVMRPWLPGPAYSVQPVPRASSRAQYRRDRAFVKSLARPRIVPHWLVCAQNFQACIHDACIAARGIHVDMVVGYVELDVVAQVVEAAVGPRRVKKDGGVVKKS